MSTPTQINDRIALELGRAVLRAVIAEERAAQAEAKTEPDEPDPKGGK